MQGAVTRKRRRRFEAPAAPMLVANRKSDQRQK
jgi:hypothetical protein